MLWRLEQSLSGLWRKSADLKSRFIQGSGVFLSCDSNCKLLRSSLKLRNKYQTYWLRQNTDALNPPQWSGCPGPCWIQTWKGAAKWSAHQRLSSHRWCSQIAQARWNLLLPIAVFTKHISKFVILRLYELGTSFLPSVFPPVSLPSKQLSINLLFDLRQKCDFIQNRQKKNERYLLKRSAV